MLSDAQLVAAYLNDGDKSLIIDRHRQFLVECLTDRVGEAQAANVMADVVLADVFADAAQFDPTELSFFSFALLRARKFDAWESPASRVRGLVAQQLCWESTFNPLPTAEFNHRLELRLSDLFASSLGVCIMRPTIDRLIEAGHFAQVHEAGRFAAAKAEVLIGGGRITGVRWEPASDHPANELFLLVNALNDTDELNAIADYIEEQFAADYAVA